MIAVQDQDVKVKRSRIRRKNAIKH